MKLRGDVLVLTHRDGDFDAVGSAMLIGELIKILSNDVRDVVVAVPDDVSKPVKQFAERFKIPLSFVRELNDVAGKRFESVVLTDVSSLTQVNDFRQIVESAVSVILIDHHVVHDEVLAGDRVIKFVDPQATSSCEIVLRELQDLVDKVPNHLVPLLVAAILVESRRLSRASPETFFILGSLVRHLSIPYDEIVRALFQREVPLDERMARVKGVLRTIAYRFDDRILCVSHVSAYEASLARALLDVGCDVVVIVSEHEDEFRVIARSRVDGVSMAELTRRISRRFGGDGGGHERAGVGVMRRSDRISLRTLMLESVRAFEEMTGIRLRRISP